MERFRAILAARWPRELFAAAILSLTMVAGGLAGLCRADQRPVIENSIGMKLVSIPAGEFLMGATEEETVKSRQATKEGVLKQKNKGNEGMAKILEQNLESLQSELPQHRVVITKPFFLGKYEVTQKEFSAVMGFNPSLFSPNSKGKKKDLVAGLDTSLLPVESVSWEDAVEFCQQLSALPEELAAGRTYRLPTEAQWEYAFRAGTTTKFYWGDEGTGKNGKGIKWVSDDYVWSSHNSDLHPHPAGQKRPNAWGLFDMAGNAAEWCADWYDPLAYAAAPRQDPAGPSSGTKHIVRGKNFNTPVNEMRSAGMRVGQLPSMRNDMVGFRVACDMSAPPQAVATAPEPTSMQDVEAQLKQKGLARRMGYFLLPEEAQFIRYCTTIERLRMACFHAQKECLDAQRQLSRVLSAKAGAVQSRMQARSAIGYSDTWREHWAATRAKNQASDAMMLVDLSKEGVQKWQQDAQKDLDSAVELFSQQIDKLQKMYQKLQADYAKLYEDKTVKHALAQMNSQSKSAYRIGPTPREAAAMKKLEHEQGLLAQFKKP